MTEPSLSIVIAACPNLAGVADCLESLGRQRDHSMECVVVSSISPPKELCARFPWVRWSHAAADCLIPHLWGQGMARSRGDIIAITTAHFTPARDWVEAIRSAHARWQSCAVGGKIDGPRDGGAVGWAIYFLRYSAYLGYHQEQAVPDVAGDNASYKRSALKRLPNLLRDGFWELEFHRRLRMEGQAPVFVPTIQVTQHQRFGFWCFFRQRFRHGQQFGRSRAQRWGTAIRLAAGIASPLIPVLFVIKIVSRVLRSGRHIGRFLLALPALVCFLLAWSAGEGYGYLFGARRGNTRPTQSGNDTLSAFDSPASAEVPLCP
jgi:GT2 family glycosyltransferase